mmetsp:Transcript_2169/g.6097  ORF Transcript_2169/g.6097 Transcript_2169/m.6097 type:complete len:200 (+) Transcript_2169:1303-1902(+)
MDCWEADSPKTWSKFQVRIPIPGDTVSTFPEGPGVTESTEALKPEPHTAATSALTPVSMCPVCGLALMPVTGLGLGSASSLIILMSSSSSSKGFAAPHCLFSSILIAAARLSPGWRCWRSATRWPRGNVTGALTKASNRAPSRAAGGAGRMRQKVEMRHLPGAVLGLQAPASAPASAGGAGGPAKRRRSGQSSSCSIPL